MTTTIKQSDNTQGVQLPKTVLDSVNIKEGEEVEIFIQNNMIVIKPHARKRKTIEELFENYDGNYEVEQIDWGKPEGKEIW